MNGGRNLQEFSMRNSLHASDTLLFVLAVLLLDVLLNAFNGLEVFDSFDQEF
jgi:hypothetical protein